MDEAIVWSVNNGADIINISPYGPYSHCDDVFDNLYNAIDHARAMGVPVFGAATCGWQDGHCTLTGRRAPADCEEVTGVGATYGGQIRYNTDQDLAYEVSGQAAPSWAAGHVSGYAANMLLEYPEIYDESWLTDIDDHLLLALQCRAYYGQAGDIELACCGWAGIAFTCEQDCTLEWCP
jgi:hypothetical protein